MPIKYERISQNKKQKVAIIYFNGHEFIKSMNIERSGWIFNGH